jgi:hypothetical protein
MRVVLWLALLVCAAWAGPVEFGMAEVQRAISERGIRPGVIRFKTELTLEPPESYRILPGRITGGDLRGLMYGLLEAAEQIRVTGRLTAARGEAATPLRGIRILLHHRDLEPTWYHSRDYWIGFLRMLARNRFNRFNLVFAHQTYPFWVTVPEFPEIRVPGLSDEERHRNLETLRFISQTAAEHAIDFTLGIWEHSTQSGMTTKVDGLTPDKLGPYTYLALKRVLTACPAIRSIQMRTAAASGSPETEFYRDWVFKAVRESGRRVTLDLRGGSMRPDLLEAATGAGPPLRLSTRYWSDRIGRPYQFAEAAPDPGDFDYLRKPRTHDLYWELGGLDSHRLLLWGDPDFVRRAVPTFRLAGASGFEIDPPFTTRDSENQSADRGFERYWFFYLLWGRLAYDPKTPDFWTREFTRRFGAAGADVLETYRAASRILPELVAVHSAGTGMFLSPEVSTGDLLPSDSRYVASISEAVRNGGAAAGAKQTPLETAARLDQMAGAVERAADRAAARLSSHPEWRGSEPDFRMLAALARYHARKQIAAFQLAWFDEHTDPGCLHRAKQELTQALSIWEALVRLPDGLYHGDASHWKDQLPDVRRDLELIEERERNLVFTAGNSAAPVPASSPPATSLLAPPGILHMPPKSALAGTPLPLTLRLWPIKDVTTVRLHYRPVSRVARFKTLEAAPARLSFIIPSEDISAGFDLMYYFEILNRHRSGWFHPDPHAATPYYVIPVGRPTAAPVN